MVYLRQVRIAKAPRRSGTDAPYLRGHRSDVAAEMVRIHEVIDPRPDHVGHFRESYLRFAYSAESHAWPKRHK